MVLVVKCLICSKELNYEQNDLSELISHVRQEHPQIKQNSRKFNRPSDRQGDEFKQKAEESLNQSLRRNSMSFNSLIDNETQTDIVWSNLFKKMNKQKNTARSSKETPRTSKESFHQTPRSSKETHEQMARISSASPRVSEESKKHRSSDTTMILKSPSAQPREVVSSPSRFSDDLQKFNERTRLKTSTPVKPTRNLTKQMKDLESVRLDVGKEAKVLFTKSEDEGKTLEFQKGSLAKKKMKFYKTSIEKWRPVGDEKIHCPRCQSHKRPVVRTHTERVTQSSFATTLLMTCWPLCMSPCLFPEPTQENLHCPVCNYHFGVYDHVLKVVMSNPELSQ